MTIIVYGIKSCSTMKKTFTLLDELTVSYEFHDYKKQAVSVELVTEWVEALGLDKVLNKRGTTWRKQSDEDKAQAESSQAFAIELLVNNTSMIKRPIIQGTADHAADHAAVLLCGFDESLVTEAFSH